MNEQNQQSQQLLNILSQHLSGGNGNEVQTPTIPSQQIEKIPVTSYAANGTNGANPTTTSNGTNGHAAVGVLTPTTKQTGMDLGVLTSSLLEVVSEKTGYPAEMLELNMDMEADLGIDSIKRVEIFGALTKQYPGMSGINPQELTELRTLGEIVNYVTQNAKGSINTTTAPSTKTARPVSNGSTNGTTKNITPSAPTTTTAPSTNNGELEKILLDVVSEKTGYPAEMLELSMDLEADLGIDSIKRVEIFGALTKQYPEMSGINPQELTELRTLGEIVEFVGAKKAMA